MHYYQFNIADYRKDTTHLSRLEHSIYRDLIDWCYLDEAPIPLDLSLVSRKLRLCSADDERALNNVLTDFFECTNEGYTQKRIRHEIECFHLTIANASKAGKASAEARKNKKLERTLNDRSTNQEPITNNQEPIKEEKTSRAPRFDAQAHLVSIGVDASIAADWIQSRKQLKATPTQTAIDGIAKEAARAGISLADALALCCQRGWRGFKAEWVKQEHAGSFSDKRQERDSAFLSAIGLSGRSSEKLIEGEVV